MEIRAGLGDAERTAPFVDFFLKRGKLRNLQLDKLARVMEDDIKRLQT